MTPDYDDEYATCKRTFATLRIFAPDLDPGAVTKALAVVPTRSFVQGDLIGRSGAARKQGSWLLETEGEVISGDLRRHIDWLLDKIDPKADALRAIVQSGATADVFCYWESRWGHGGPELSPHQTQRLANLGLSVGLDVYFPVEPDVYFDPDAPSSHDGRASGNWHE